MERGALKKKAGGIARAIIVAKFFRDMVVVVASILVAFALDAWWDDRADQGAEQVLLMSLRDEFSENAGMLLQSQRRFEAAMSASMQLLALTGQEEIDGEPVGVDKMLVNAVGGYSTNPSTGATDALLSSGKLGLISNHNLRTRLAAWPGVLEEYLEEEQRAEAEIDAILFPVVRDLTSLRSLVSQTALLAGVGPGRHATDYRALLSSREFENALVARAVTLSVVKSESAMLRKQIDEVLKIINAELQSQ